MTFDSVLSFVGALLGGSLGGFVVLKDTRSLVHRTFAVGMLALALEAGLTGLSLQAVLPEEVLRWQRLRLVAAAFLPGSWLLFSLSFARANYKEFVAEWRWIILAAFAFPLALTTFLADSIFIDAPVLDASSGWLLRLGWFGYAFHVFILLSAVFILMNLERTLRASTGTKRWQIKFMVLGLGSLFAVRLYTSTHTLLFSSVNMAMESVNSSAVIVAAVLIILSLARAGPLNVDIYLSPAFLYNSITVFVVGTYLLAVGVLAKAIPYSGDSQILSLGTIFVFLSLLGLTVILLSDQLRQHVKQFINYHFRQPRYDYRKEWTRFTRRT